MLARQSYEAKLHHTLAVKHLEVDLAEMLLAAIVGCVTGAIAGFVGAVFGACFGAFVGLLAGVIANREEVRSARHTAKLDREIGIIDGTLGTRWVRHMPARIGAFSMGSAGGARVTQPPASGPIPEDGVNGS